MFSSIHTGRLVYVLHWIFTEQLGLTCRITADEEEWRQWQGPKLVYDKQVKPEGSICLHPSGLLEEEGIRSRSLSMQRWKKTTVLFYNQPGALIPFDLFSAVFYLLSRYEEYLPFTPDRHGRFPASASAAGQYAFLEQPVVDEWIGQLKRILEHQFALTLKRPPCSYQVSFDVDIAWHYLYKGWRRQWGGRLKDILSGNVAGLRQRRAVLAGEATDPFDCFDELLRLPMPEKPLFFFLLGRGSKYDRNIDPSHPAMKQLIEKLSDQYPMGIHPSYAAHGDPAMRSQEITLLEHLSGQSVTNSRQHYVKFTLPDTYRQLIRAGIRNEYSMGYPEQNGFRAGTSRHFLWYDLKREALSDLRVHPFVYMDATSWYYQQHSVAEAFSEWERLYLKVKETEGCFVSIWHNHLLGYDQAGEERRTFFKQTLQYAQA